MTKDRLVAGNVVVDHTRQRNGVGEVNSIVVVVEQTTLNSRVVEVVPSPILNPVHIKPL
jgi:hypothetical protein